MSGAQMTEQLPDGLNSSLTRVQVAAALTAAGYPISPSTLSTMATRGGGPPYRNFGPRVLYLWGEALEWAQARMSKPRRAPAELRESAAA